MPHALPLGSGSDHLAAVGEALEGNDGVSRTSCTSLIPRLILSLSLSLCPDPLPQRRRALSSRSHNRLLSSGEYSDGLSVGTMGPARAPSCSLKLYHVSAVSFRQWPMEYPAVSSSRPRSLKLSSLLPHNSTATSQCRGRRLCSSTAYAIRYFSSSSPRRVVRCFR
jgi:hypothetical protein